RNDVARKRQARQRIDDRRRNGGKIARQEGGARNGGEERQALRRPQPLVRSEHEQLVLPDRTAGGATKLIALELRLADREEVLGVEPVAPYELGRGARRSVRSRLRDDRHDGVAL